MSEREENVDQLELDEVEGNNPSPPMIDGNEQAVENQERPEGPLNDAAAAGDIVAGVGDNAEVNAAGDNVDAAVDNVEGDRPGRRVGLLLLEYVISPFCCCVVSVIPGAILLGCCVAFWLRR